MSEKQGSQPTYRLRPEKDVSVKMRDGVALAVNVFRPDAAGKFPALLAMSPYGKDKQTIDLPAQPPESPLYSSSLEAGDSSYFVSRGYAHVIADVRGIGKSGGEYLGWMSRNEAEDGYDLVEWIARQPWCDGNVGMVGISYFGTIQLSVAAEQPPHLKAIMPLNAPADFYRECTYHGGVPQMFFNHIYGESIKGRHASAVIKENAPAEIERLVEAAKSNPDIQMYPEFYNIVLNPERVPCLFDIIVQPLDGPFYRARSACTKYEKIKIPCYLGSGWWAYGHMHLRGAFQNYLGIKAPKKLVIDSPAVLERPLPAQYNEAAVRWYDYWLKGMDNGIMAEPPVKIFIMGANRWRFEQEWPLARTRWTKYYLHRWQRLLPEPEDCPGRPDCFVQQPLSETATVHSVSYLTPPLVEDTEITGPMSLYLYASIDTSDTNWIVALSDVAEGREVELSRGWLKASHRAVDEGKSQPWQPYHPHTEPQPVPPGEISQYAIELSPTSNVFKAGHRIKLEITSLDHAKALAPTANIGRNHMPYHICSSRTTLHKVYHAEEHPSYLLLPVIESGTKGST